MKTLLFVAAFMSGCTTITYRELDCMVVVMPFDSTTMTQDTLGWYPDECEELCSDGGCTHDS